MSGTVVVDASVAVKWFVSEEYSDVASALLRSWDEREIKTVAPHLLPFEVSNALYRKVARKEISQIDASRLVANLLAVQLEFHDVSHLHARAIELAGELGQRTAYDSHYLALAEALDCEFWTADRRFYRAAGRSIDRVRWIGEFRMAR